MQALYANLEFSPSSSTTVSGSDGGNAVGFLPGGSFFVVQKLNPDWSVGFGVPVDFLASQGNHVRDGHWR